MMGVTTAGVRSSTDFYRTPPHATHSLFDKEVFEGDIWDPCCGDGWMTNVIIERHKDGVVFASDIEDRNYPVGNAWQFDFLTNHENETDNVIANPPYCDAQAFAEKALEVAEKKVALLLRITFLEGQKRKPFLESSPLKSVHVFSKRVGFGRELVEAKSGLLCFAWFVWEKGYEGKPGIDWI